MTLYRLYILESGSLPGIGEIEAGDDAEAARIARERADSCPVEIWCGSRRVRTLAPLKGGPKHAEEGVSG